MHRPISCALAVLLAAPAHSQEATAAQKGYGTLIREFNEAEKAFDAAWDAAATDADRAKIAKEKRPDLSRYSERMLAIAAQYPDDPAAIDCLSWVVWRNGGEHARALQMLARYVESPAIRIVCDGMTEAKSPAAEQFLRLVIAKNTDHGAQAWAHYALARLLGRRPDAKAQKETEELLERVRAKFADVETAGSTMGAEAKVDLEQLRHHGLGRPVPEIEGVDVDGVKFKLSDYRGKVVFLDFWGFW